MSIDVSPSSHSGCNCTVSLILLYLYPDKQPDPKARPHYKIVQSAIPIT